MKGRFRSFARSTRNSRIADLERAGREAAAWQEDKRRRKERLRKEGLGFMGGTVMQCASCEMLKIQLKQANMRILELEIMLNLRK